MTYQDRLLKAIPGGAHTYSRGYDQFPSNAPQILKRGKGAYIYDDVGKEYLDYGMGLRSVIVGYAEEGINQAAIKQIEYGNNLTRPSLIELEAAELMIDTIDSIDMIKFTKNGSTATTAAVKLSRAFTGRNMVARCHQHPFFSYDDWFIGSTHIRKGVPEYDIENTILFNFNDIDSLELLFEQYPHKIACVILEPASTEEPVDNFLQKVKDICHKNGAVFILDEMITGFRWHLKGAQHYYDVDPDLCTFGKAMANGFSVACVAGKREIMEQGSIEFEGRERLFLLSTTHGAEMCGLGALVETIKYLKEYDVIDHIWECGRRLVDMMVNLSKDFGLENSFKCIGLPCSPAYITLDKEGKNSMELRTVFVQEMLRNGVMMAWISQSYRHGDKELEITKIALEKSFKTYQKAYEEGVDKYLSGNIIKPVFRRYN